MASLLAFDCTARRHWSVGFCLRSMRERDEGDRGSSLEFSADYVMMSIILGGHSAGDAPFSRYPPSHFKVFVRRQQKLYHPMRVWVVVHVHSRLLSVCNGAT